MTNCTNCNPKAFDIVESDSIVTASGLSLQSVLDGFVEDILSIRDDMVVENSADTGIGSLTSINSPLAVVSSEPITITITPGKTNTIVQYDLKKVLLNSKQDIITVEFFGNKNGLPGRLGSLTTSVGSFNASPENFPLVIKVDITTILPNGQKIISLQKTLNNVLTTVSEYPIITDLAKSSITTQKEVNEFFDAQISTLKNQLKLILDSLNG